MRTSVFIIFFVLWLLPYSELQAQNDFAVLEKNKNIRAKGLTQALNATKDTLILRSNTLIHKVYAVNMNYKREVDLRVMDTAIEIPLTNLSRGKHVFVAVQSPLRFVFVVKVIGDDSVLLALDDSHLTSKDE